eukprot:GEMP01004898.1.p1 GENE.GEMP01004898.1~~GEMP01004898.1.p1  ORF type:complete len:1107 (+),score=275.15 GEMP01004898.1:558-3878(+)
MGSIYSSLLEGDDHTNATAIIIREQLKKHQPAYLMSPELHLATIAKWLSKEHVTTVEEDLAEDVNIDDSASDRGYTVDDPLLAAILRGQSIKAMMMLNGRKSCNVEVCDIKLRTPLYAAAVMGNIRVLKMLISQNVDVNRRGPDGWTALHVSVLNGFVACVTALIEAKADVNMLVIDHQGRRKSTTLEVGCMHILASSPKLYRIDLVTRKEMKLLSSHRRRARWGQVKSSKSSCDALELFEKTGQTSAKTPKLGYKTSTVAKALMKSALSLARIRSGRCEVVRHSVAGLSSKKYTLLWKHQPNRIELILFNALLDDPALQLDMKDSCGKTALLWAAEFGNLHLISRLLHEQVNIEAKDDQGLTALCHAVMREHLEVVNVLVTLKANVMQTDASFRTPLHLAVETDNTAVSMSILHAHGDHNALDSKGRTPFMMAMHMDDRSFFSKLLEKGPQFDHIDARGWNIFIYAINANFFSAFVPVLNKLAAEAPREVVDNILLYKDPQGFTALHHAIQQKSLQSVQMLFHLCTNGTILATAQDCNGHTSLHEACLAGDLEVLSVIVKEVTDVDEPTNNFGETGLMLCAMRGHVDCVVFLLNSKRLMVAADPSRKDNGGKSFLMHACVGGSLDLVNLILLNKEGYNSNLEFATINVNLQDKSGATALMMCAREGNWHLIPSLVMAMADLTMQDTDGFSALHWACMDNDNHGVLTLIDLYADMNQVDFAGWTPLMHACSVGAIELVRLLAERGADLMVHSYSRETCFTIALTSKIRGECAQLLADCMRDQMAPTGLMSTRAPTKGYFVVSVLSATNLRLENMRPIDLNVYAYVQFCSHKDALVMSAITSGVLASGDPEWHEPFRFEIDARMDESSFLTVHLFTATPDKSGNLAFKMADDGLQEDPVARNVLVSELSKDHKETLDKAAKTEKMAMTNLLERGTPLESRFLWDNVGRRKWGELETLQRHLRGVLLPPVPRHHIPLGFMVVSARVLRDSVTQAHVIHLKDRLLRGAIKGKLNVDIEFRPSLWRIIKEPYEPPPVCPVESLVEVDFVPTTSLKRSIVLKNAVKPRSLRELLVFAKECAEYKHDPEGMPEPKLNVTDDVLRELRAVKLM